MRAKNSKVGPVVFGADQVFQETEGRVEEENDSKWGQHKLKLFANQGY